MQHPPSLLLLTKLRDTRSRPPVLFMEDKVTKIPRRIEQEGKPMLHQRFHDRTRGPVSAPRIISRG